MKFSYSISPYCTVHSCYLLLLYIAPILAHVVAHCKSFRSELALAGGVVYRSDWLLLVLLL